MRVINLDFYENEFNFYLDNKKDRLNTTINFIMNKDFEANNTKFNYKLLFIDIQGRIISQEIKADAQFFNNVISYTIPTHVKEILPKKGQLQLRVLINDASLVPGVFCSHKYNYIIGDNLDFNIV